MSIEANASPGASAKPLNIAIVGGGKDVADFLRLAGTLVFGGYRFNVVGIANLNPDAEGVQLARNEWGYGVAGAVVNSSGKWFYGVLLTQSWRAVDPQTLPTGTSDTNPLGIAPFLNYRIGNGWYVGNGDMVAQYDWDSNKLFLPIGVRVGKVNVTDKGSTWNMYVEYQTSAVYKSYPGPAVQNSIRFNVTYAIPVF